MKYLLLAITLLAFNANSTALLLGGWTKHHVPPEEEEFNQSHQMIGIEHNNWIVATLNNSYNHRSTLAAYRWQLAEVYNFKLSVVGGLVTGYTDDQAGFARVSGRLALYLLPVVTYTIDITPKLAVGADLGAIWRNNGYISSTSLRVEYKF